MSSGRCHGLEHLGHAKNKQQSARAEHPGLEHLVGRRGKKSSARSPSWIIRGKRSRQAAGPRASGASQGGGTNKKGKRLKKKDQEQGTGRRER